MLSARVLNGGTIILVEAIRFEDNCLELNYNRDDLCEWVFYEVEFAALLS